MLKTMSWNPWGAPRLFLQPSTDRERVTARALPNVPRTMPNVPYMIPNVPRTMPNVPYTMPNVP
jgi:hypothetical protein